MKAIFALIVLMSSSAFAAPLEAIDCKQEILAAALSERVNSTSLEMLNSGYFEVIDIGYSHTDDYDYAVTVQVTSRVDKTTYTSVYGVSADVNNNCKTDVKLFAD